MAPRKETPTYLAEVTYDAGRTGFQWHCHIIAELNGQNTVVATNDYSITGFGARWWAWWTLRKYQTGKAHSKQVLR